MACNVRKIFLFFGIVLCATIHDYLALDLTTPVRCVIWSCVTLILFLSVKEFSFPKKFIYPAFAGYLLFTSFSMLWATNVSESLYWSLRVFMLFVYFCLVVSIFKDIPKKTMALIGMCLGVYGVFGTVEWMTDPAGGTTAMEVTGLMSNRNLWCAAQLLFLPYCIFVYKQWKCVSITGTLAIVFNLSVLFAKSSFLGLLVSVGVVSLFCRKLRWVVLAGVIPVVVVCLFRMENIRETDSFRQRLEIWPQTIKMTLDSPWGVGAGNWRIDIQRYANDIDIDEAFTRIFYQRPHNDFLWVLSEIGILGFLCYGSLFALSFYYSVKSKNYIVIMGLTAYIVLASFTFPRERAFHSMMLVLYFAFSVIHYERAKVKLPTLITVLVSFILLFCVVNFSCRLKQDHNMRIIRATNDINVIIDVTDKYIPFCPLDLTSMPVMWYRGFAFAGLGNFREAKKHFINAQKTNPYHMSVLGSVAECYVKEGDYQNAIVCLQQMQDIKESAEVAEQLKVVREMYENEQKNIKTTQSR